MDLGLSFTDGMVSSGICDRRDGFSFGMVVFPFLDGDVPRSPSCGVCVSRLVCFARVCVSVGGFGGGDLFLAAGLLKQGCGCRRVGGSFSELCHRHSELIVKCMWGLFCGRACRNLCFVVIWFVNSSGLFEGLILVINSKGL